MRGPPLPPLVIVPAHVSELTADRFGDDVYLQLTIPEANGDGSEPADLDRVEVYALTTQPAEGQPRLGDDEWLELATLVATLPVERPLDEDEEDSDPLEDAAQQSLRYPQGAEVTLVEVLTPEVRVPVEVHEGQEPVTTDPEVEIRPPGPLVSPPLPQPLRRAYVAQAVSRRGRESPLSSRVAAPLGPVPDPPGPPKVTYTAESVSFAWSAPTTARLPLQQPQLDGALGSTSVLPPQTPSRYEVYNLTASVRAVEADTDAETDLELDSDPVEDVTEGEGEDNEPGIRVPSSVHEFPLAVTSYTGAAPIFGVEHCFVVRTIDVVDPVDELEVRSAPSEPACVMFVDTFPPAPPAGLLAVASDGTISLTWVESTADDVAGYIVLRGDAPGATLSPLITDPVAATNYRDTSVEAGTRYTYAVQTIDDATPPNASAPSLTVVEQAR